MYDVREELLEIVEETKQLHTRERSITLESVSLVGELERRNAAVNLSMTSEQFAVHIGLTPNQYWKRAQAARLIRFHPEAQKLLESGETQVSHSGHMPSLPEIFVKALEDLLDKRDPLRKAERAKARFENSPAPAPAPAPAKTAKAEAEPEVEVVSEPASPGKRDQGPVKKPAIRPAIPAQVS